MLNTSKSVVSLVFTKYTTLTMSVVLIVFASSVIVGWYAHIDALIRYELGTNAMVYNTALLFVLCGICIFTSIFNMRIIPIATSLFVLVFGAVGLAQHVFEINLGIDQLFFTHYYSFANTYPGRMAPNTALCFIVIASALLLVNNFKLQEKFLNIAIGLGMLTLALDLVFISGYLSNLQHAYSWVAATPMSIPAAVGFVLLSVATIFLVCQKAIVHNVDLTKSLPLICALCILSATVLLVDKVGEHELQNNYISNLPIITMVIGITAAIVVGLLLRLGIIANNAASSYKKALSVMRATLEATADGIIVIDLDGNDVAYNGRFLQMWGLPQDDMRAHAGQSLTNLIVDQLLDTEKYYIMSKQLDLDPCLEIADQIRLKNGNVFECHVRPQIIGTNIVGRVFCYRDVTLQKRLETELLHQATYDSLTRLPNRALLLDLITRGVEAANVNSKILSVLLIDIDKLSQINDLFGRSKGDDLLKEIANRLSHRLQSDTVLGRVGGNQFLLITNNLAKVQNIVPLINMIFTSLDKPFDLFSQEVKVSVSIGVAFYPKDGRDSDNLISNADIAMLRAKSNGLNQFQFYSQDMSSYIFQHIELETQLHKAMEDEQFVVYYQPIIDIRNNKLAGVEALVRWKQPHHGIVSPSEFIPLAEEIGLIQQIGEWVLRSACMQAKIWHDAGFADLKVSVNISAHQFKYGLLVETVTNILKQTNIRPDLLELELTESVLIGGDETIIKILKNLSVLGVSLSIDDFGTGYSSFSYVKRFPIDKIKIDRSFIGDIRKSDEDEAIVRAMIAMCKSLNMTVLAEGIETIDELRILQVLGCDLGQGYYFSKPLPVEDCIAYFKNPI